MKILIAGGTGLIGARLVNSLISVGLRCSWSGASTEEKWSCCSISKKCGLNEGDCDSDNDCLGNLRCGLNNCVGSQFHPEADCCHDNAF